MHAAAHFKISSCETKHLQSFAMVHFNGAFGWSMQKCTHPESSNRILN